MIGRNKALVTVQTIPVMRNQYAVPTEGLTMSLTEFPADVLYADGSDLDNGKVGDPISCRCQRSALGSHR